MADIMKKLSGLFVLLIFSIISSISFAQTTEITDGLNYLTSTQNVDGSWSDAASSTEVLPGTVAVLETMHELGEVSSQNYLNGVTWLQNQTLDTTDYLSERIHALSAAGADELTLLVYLDSIYADAWGGYADYDANNLDTALAIQALHKINFTDLDTIGFALSYLIDNQNIDGGFGFYSGDDSNVFMTATVLKTFSLFKNTFLLQSEIDDAAAYLLYQQNPDGGFGSGVSTVYETALATMALIESGQGNALPLQSTITYIQTNQQPDGSWDNDPYSTALALRALLKVKPNLSISQSDIAFSNSVPTIGETVSITATIYNNGLLNADSVFVRFYNGDPSLGGLLIGEETIVQVPSSGSAPASINWVPSEYSNTQIFIAVDPLNAIDELNETDNIAHNNIYVGTGPNLIVSSIIFTPEVAIIDQLVDTTFTITNIGETPVTNAFVEYYRAEAPGEDLFLINPEDYVKIGENTIPELLPGENVPVTLQSTFTQGFHNIKAIIDPLNGISETDESDNESNSWITSLPEQTDLIINSTLVISPKNPKANDDITIFAQAHNLGSIAAYAVSAAIFDGDPNAGGFKLGEQTIDMRPIDYQQLEFHVTLTQGVHDLYLVLDPANAFIEADETNNQAVKSVTVDMASNVDFSISTSDIIFDPVQPLPGDTITITATIHNLGVQSETASVSFYNANPSYGGTKIQDTIVTVNGNGTTDTNINYIVDGKPTTIFVVIDEDDTIYEQKEDNNKAFKKLSIGMPDLMVRDKDIKINKMSDGSIYISPLIRNMGGIDAVNVAVSIYNGDPVSGGTLISNQTIALISAGSGHRINVPYSLLQGRNDLYVVADPDDLLLEITELNNTGFKVLFGTDPNGPDITVTNIDSTGITTDIQMLTVNGSLLVDLENTSIVDITIPFTLTAYEDLNKNSFFDDGIDNKLGETAYSNGLPASSVNSISINISGQVNFRDNHIHVMADSGDAVFEKNEENNNRHHKEDCKITPEPVENSDVVEKWAWMGSDFEPTSNMVRMAPVIANMSDDNGDGVIDEDDIPDIIFVSQGSMVTSQGILRVISGRDGEEIWSATHPDGIKSFIMSIAVGDIDNNGDPEIIVPLINDRELVAYNHDGSILWTSETVPYPYMGGVAPFIADIDNDGNPEIYKGRVLFDNKGQIVWRHTNFSAILQVPIAVDLNNDDTMEIINTKTAYNSDGTTLWFQGMIGSNLGYNAIGNFDGDIYPEVVNSGNARVDLMEHDKTIKWTFRDNIDHRYELQSAPAVGDVDGDGTPEIAVAGTYIFTVFNGDGTIRWEVPMYDATGGTITPIFFDLNGDGKAEIAVNDGRNFFIFNGDTGQILFQTPNPASTAYEVPAVADVDNDGNVEFIVFGGVHAYNDPYYGGIRILGEQNGNWVNSKRIWNQHSYHVTNIDEDGYIPLREENSWEKVNCYRCNVPLDNALDTPDITASRIVIDQTGYPEGISITARIGNAGTLLVKEGAIVSFYSGDPVGSGTLLGSSLTSKRLNPGEFEDLSFTLVLPLSRNLRYLCCG